MNSCECVWTSSGAVFRGEEPLGITNIHGGSLIDVCVWTGGNYAILPEDLEEVKTFLFDKMQKLK